MAGKLGLANGLWPIMSAKSTLLPKNIRKRLAKQVKEHSDYTLPQYAQLWHYKYKKHVSELTYR